MAEYNTNARKRGWSSRLCGTLKDGVIFSGVTLSLKPNLTVNTLAVRRWSEWQSQRSRSSKRSTTSVSVKTASSSELQGDYLQVKKEPTEYLLHNHFPLLCSCGLRFVIQCIYLTHMTDVLWTQEVWQRRRCSSIIWRNGTFWGFADQYWQPRGLQVGDLLLLWDCNTAVFYLCRGQCVRASVRSVI